MAVYTILFTPSQAGSNHASTSLLRLQQRAWISATWGISENNRKAKFYAITRSGRKQLGKEVPVQIDSDVALGFHVFSSFRNVENQAE